MGELKHTRLVPRSTVTTVASAAASAVADAGGSPRAQIDAARAAGGQRLVYTPHQGARERERNLKRLARQTRIEL